MAQDLLVSQVTEKVAGIESRAREIEGFATEMETTMRLTVDRIAKDLNAKVCILSEQQASSQMDVNSTAAFTSQPYRYIQNNISRVKDKQRWSSGAHSREVSRISGEHGINDPYSAQGRRQMIKSMSHVRKLS